MTFRDGDQLKLPRLQRCLSLKPCESGVLQEEGVLPEDQSPCRGQPSRDNLVRINENFDLQSICKRISKAFIHFGQAHVSSYIWGLTGSSWLIVASFLSQPEPVSPLMLPPKARDPALTITAKDCNALSSTYGSCTGAATVHAWQYPKKFLVLHLHFHLPRQVK